MIKRSTKPKCYLITERPQGKSGGGRLKASDFGFAAKITQLFVQVTAPVAGLRRGLRSMPPVAFRAQLWHHTQRRTNTARALCSIVWCAEGWCVNG